LFDVYILAEGGSNRLTLLFSYHWNNQTKIQYNTLHGHQIFVVTNGIQVPQWVQGILLLSSL